MRVDASPASTPGARPHHSDPEERGLLVKIELSAPRVKIALVSRSALEL